MGVINLNMVKIMIIDKKDYRLASEALKNNKVVAYPTDTVYGLAVRFGSEKARLNLVARKKRPEEKYFPVMVSDIEMMEKIAVINDSARKIIEKFMPGPLTVVLNKKIDFGDNGTLAIRIAHDETLKKIIEEIACPIFLTSANLSGNPVCKTALEIEESGLADIIVDGEILDGTASTIIDLTGEEIKVLREGPISLGDLLTIKGSR